ATEDMNNARVHLDVFHIESDQLAGTHTRIQQEKTDGTITRRMAALEDGLNFCRGEWLEDLLFDPRQFHFAKWRALHQLITYTVVEKGADGAAYIVLILARKLSLLQINKVPTKFMRSKVSE